MKDISLIKNTFANFVTLEVDLEKLKYTSDTNQHKAYNSETPRRNNVLFDDIHLIKVIEEMPNESIYDGARAAQPDEIWNYQRGDGLEKAIALITCWKNRYPQQEIKLIVQQTQVTLNFGKTIVKLPSKKNLQYEVVL